VMAHDPVTGSQAKQIHQRIPDPSGWLHLALRRFRWKRAIYCSAQGLDVNRTFL
jgi:hypothetical protein